ncbi:hypothetical protein AB0F72_17665 [Actinoplanes sp. NPDC023936]|uniref:hypothetical protein n=1 Tax=Actinoplanes sp. NPDC023936 TaxID=3154910 RepID=UPI0033EE38E5
MDRKMRAGDTVVALAASVQELIRARYPHRPWSQLVACLDAEERKALGGGDDRQLAQRISAQFGARSQRGPCRPLVDVALRRCLPAMPVDQQDSRRAQVERCWQAVHGAVPAGTAPPVPVARARGAGLREQLRQEQEKSAALAEQLTDACPVGRCWRRS